MATRRGILRWSAHRSVPAAIAASALAGFGVVLLSGEVLDPDPGLEPR